MSTDGSPNSAERELAVAVFCGSSTGAKPRYVACARAVGRELARQRVTLVYGGAGIGLMGELADACLAAGGRVVGVIPALLAELELAHPGLSELHVVDSMAERKALMAELAQGFLALPGGYGTLDEAFEMVTWRQLGLHPGPLVFVNVDGYFDGLRAFLDRATADGLISARNRELARFAADEVEGVRHLLWALGRS